MRHEEVASEAFPEALLYVVFLLSGFAALLYQLIWQRALFTLFGTNSESVTIVVTAFMLGLGAGGVAGGAISRSSRVSPPVLFGLLELGIGAYGVLSLGLFRWAGAEMAGIGGAELALRALLLLLIPTVLMGATLPLLVAHLVRQSGNVGRSVGALYSVNTLGSALGCFAGARFVFGALGQAGSVRLAAAVNVCVAAAVLLGHARRRAST